MWQYERIHENTWICHICSLHINSWWNMMEPWNPESQSGRKGELGRDLRRCGSHRVKNGAPTDPENWPCLGHGANHFCWIMWASTSKDMDYIMLVVSFFVQFLILFWDGYCSEAPQVPSCGAPIRRRGAFQLEIDPGLSGPITAGDYYVAILNAISEDWIIKNNRGKKTVSLFTACCRGSKRVAAGLIKNGSPSPTTASALLSSVISQAATLQRWAP